MAKPLVLQFAGVDLPFALEKVDRAELYGYVEVEALDEKGRRCTLATLADDGRTLVGSGGTAIATLSPEGNWLDKSQLTAVDVEGKKITPVASSFSAPVRLAKAVSIDEYLSHNIRAVYQLKCEADIAPLLDELKKGTIFCFPYSFRGGLEADAGFVLLGADGTPFLCVGVPTKIEFVGLEQAAALTEEEATEEDEETVDFGMM